MYTKRKTGFIASNNFRSLVALRNSFHETRPYRMLLTVIIREYQVLLTLHCSFIMNLSHYISYSTLKKKKSGYQYAVVDSIKLTKNSPASASQIPQHS